MKKYTNYGIYDFSDYAEEVKENPYAYAAYMSLQRKAKEEGDPDKYKGYNVLGDKGNYSLNMTFKDFFIGKTRIDYIIETGTNTSTVTFTAFDGDGFWDADILASKNTEDGPGPNNELSGGTVYPFIPQSWSITFDNPSHMNWLSEN